LADKKGLDRNGSREGGELNGWRGDKKAARVVTKCVGQPGNHTITKPMRGFPSAPRFGPSGLGEVGKRNILGEESRRKEGGNKEKADD